jgi:ubiquinone/menaquinone biosynthesis C-methylase UbiE
VLATTTNATRRVDPLYLFQTAQTPAIRAVKERAHELLAVTAGDRVVDVGCGPGIDTIALARRVGPTGFVVGVDADPGMVREADRLATREGVSPFTRHVVADATALPLPNGEADACVSERLLQHLPWASAVLATGEIVRIVRAGGRVVVTDTDWATLSIAAEDPWLERRVVQELAATFANPFSGRHLPSLLAATGLTETSVETFDLQLSYESLEFLLRPAFAAGLAGRRIAPIEARRFSQGLRELQDYSQFFAHVSMVQVAGSIP